MSGNFKENEEPQRKGQVYSLVENMKSSCNHHNHRIHAELICVSEDEDDQEKKRPHAHQLNLLQDKKIDDLTRAKNRIATTVSDDSSDISVVLSTSGERLQRIGPRLTKSRDTGQMVLGDASLVESKTTEKIRLLLQENKDRPVYRHSYAGIEKTNHNNGSEIEKYDRFNELSRLKARLEMVRNERKSKTPSRLGHWMNRNVTDDWMVDSPSSPLKQARNSENNLNHLVSKKETHYIKTEYQRSESKTDDLDVHVEQSRLCSHVSMAYKQNDIDANEVLSEDPMIRLVYLAKELADQAERMGFLQSSNGEHLARLNSLPSLPLSTVSHHSMIFHNQGSSLTCLDPSIDKLRSHPSLTNQTSSNSLFENLLKKLQAAEEQCMELTRSKDALEASLMEANDAHFEMENLVQDLKAEVEAARAINVFLSEEFDSAKEDIATLTDRKKKLEGELQRTQNRLGDVTVYVADLELVGASLRQMVEEKVEEIDANMVLFRHQHKSLDSIMDHTREIRHQMTHLQEKLLPKLAEDSEGEKDPKRAHKLWDDWLKEALPRLDAMAMALTTCQSQLAPKVQPSDDDDKDKESSDWSLFGFIR